VTSKKLQRWRCSSRSPAQRAGRRRASTSGSSIGRERRSPTPLSSPCPPIRTCAFRHLAHGNVVDQIDKQFVPRVQVVEVGTAVTLPNNDHVRHQVYSFSPARRFELPLYAGVPAKPILFDKPGIVVLGCNIHDWMIGYIYVSESPYFAKTRADGTAVLANLPPRAYVVRVWHPQMSVAEETTHKTVDVIPGPHANAAWTLELKPETGIRRAPAPGQGRGY
jgi:plastocyanin